MNPKFRLFLTLSALIAGAAVAEPAKIECEGDYPFHLQGVTTDGQCLYWSFTSVLVKTDLTGHALSRVEYEKGHMGDLCCHAGKVYVGVNRGGARERYGDEVWQYDAATLKLERKIPTPQTILCNNGLEWSDGFFYVIGSMPDHGSCNMVHVYTEDWKYRGCRFVDSGWTLWGVQTVARIGGRLVFGYYGCPKDARMPHPSGAFAVDAQAIAFGNSHAEHAEVVPCLWRRAGGYGEGVLELNGHAWRANSHESRPRDATGRRHYTGVMVPAPELER